jgi:hypothetical protein
VPLVPLDAAGQCPEAFTGLSVARAPPTVAIKGSTTKGSTARAFATQRWPTSALPSSKGEPSARPPLPRRRPSTQAGELHIGVFRRSARASQPTWRMCSTYTPSATIPTVQWSGFDERPAPMLAQTRHPSPARPESPPPYKPRVSPQQHLQSLHDDRAAGWLAPRRVHGTPYRSRLYAADEVAGQRSISDRPGRLCGQDSLNVHATALLYLLFPPAEAWRPPRS